MPKDKPESDPAAVVTLTIGPDMQIVEREVEGEIPEHFPPFSLGVLASALLDYLDKKGLFRVKSLAELSAETPPAPSEPPKPTAKRARAKKRDPKKREP